MRICFYFVLFFIAKCLNFCCEECCGDCCCDWWNNLWEDCYKESNEEEEKKKKDDYLNNHDYLNDHVEKTKQKILQDREENEKQKEEFEKQKEELKNKIRRYLSNIDNQVENIKRNLGEDKSTKEGLFNQISKINELIENFKDDNYFVRNSIEKIRKDLKELQDLCSKAGIINFDDFYKKNEEWERFLEENGIHKQYVEEQNITEDNFSLENTLEKLRNNFGTYLLEIFKTRLFPTDKNEDKYKNEFMAFYEKYNIATWISFLTEESFNTFYENICKMTSYELDPDINEQCRKLLLDDKYLGFALLSNGDENQILDVFCDKIVSYLYNKKDIIGTFICCFKRNIVEVIKKSINQNLEIENDLKKNNSENIKNTALGEYNEAIENLDVEKVEKIKLTFFNRYQNEIASDFFPKKAKLSVLFDYVLSKGRDFYAKGDDEKIDDSGLGYVSYEDEKGKLELKTALIFGGESLNNAINKKQDITIGEFYEKQIPNVCMLFNL